MRPPLQWAEHAVTTARASAVEESASEDKETKSGAGPVLARANAPRDSAPSSDCIVAGAAFAVDRACGDDSASGLGTAKISYGDGLLGRTARQRTRPPADSP